MCFFGGGASAEAPTHPAGYAPAAAYQKVQTTVTPGAAPAASSSSSSTSKAPAGKPLLKMAPGTGLQYRM